MPFTSYVSFICIFIKLNGNLFIYILNIKKKLTAYKMLSNYFFLRKTLHLYSFLNITVDITNNRNVKITYRAKLKLIHINGT